MPWKPSRSHKFIVIEILPQSPWWYPISHDLSCAFSCYQKLVHFSPNLTSQILIIFHESSVSSPESLQGAEKTVGRVWEFFPIYLSISSTIEHGSLVDGKKKKRETRLASNPLEFSCNSCPVSQVEGQEGQQ